jgi:hypothetical protein
MGDICSTHRRGESAYSILVGKHEGKRQLGRPRRRWHENIRIDLREVEWEGVEWIHLAHDRDERGSCEHGSELSVSIKGGEFLDHLSDY